MCSQMKYRPNLIFVWEHPKFFFSVTSGKNSGIVTIRQKLKLVMMLVMPKLKQRDPLSLWKQHFSRFTAVAKSE